MRNLYNNPEIIFLSLFALQILKHLGGNNLYFSTAPMASGINRRVELHVSSDSTFRSQHLQPSSLSFAPSL